MHLPDTYYVKRLALWVKFSADDILKYFSYFFSPENIGFDISCKLSPTICMKCQSLFSSKIWKRKYHKYVVCWICPKCLLFIALDKGYSGDMLIVLCVVSKDNQYDQMSTHKVWFDVVHQMWLRRSNGDPQSMFWCLSIKRQSRRWNRFPQSSLWYFASKISQCDQMSTQEVLFDV